MAKKKNIQENPDIMQETTTTVAPLTVSDTSVPEIPATQCEDTKKTQSTGLPVKKKRVRIRKKATKKISAAIMCANPYIRRFI